MRTFAWSWLLLLAAAATAQAPKAPPGTIVDGDVGLRLDQAVTRAAPTFWGAVLVAIAGKPVLAKGHGFADRNKVPLGPQSLFDLGGAAQQLTVLAALRLAAAQKLRLDDPVSRFVVDWPVERSAMTLQDLVQHTSGLPAAMPWEGNAAATAKGAAAALARVGLTGRIGAVCRYAPANANLLALALENATGQRFEKLLQERVLRPAGMTTASPLGQRVDAKLVTARRTPGNERGEAADRAEWNWSQRGARGVLASVLDVHALLGALVGDTLLTAEQRAPLWQPLAGDEYAVSTLPGQGGAIVRVQGQCVGYRARWIVDPASRSWVVILTEDYGSTDAVEVALLAAAWQAVAELRSAAAPTAAAPAAGDAAGDGTWSAAASERFVGTFTVPRGGGTFRIERSNDGVRLVGLGLQASARLREGLWPGPGEDRLRQAEDRGLVLLGRVLADAPQVDQDGFETASVGATARAELRAWAAAHGGVTRVEYVGTTLEGHGETWFRLLGKDGEAFVRAAWIGASKWVRCGLAAEPLPFAVLLSPVRADVATGTLANGRRIVVTMEGLTGARTLVFEDGSAGDDGLLDCPEVPQAR